MENGLYTANEVAEIIADLFGDTCACNFNDIDEWLPFKCEFIESCPNTYGVSCWEQYLKYKHCKNEMEETTMDVREKLAEILEKKDNEPMQSYLDEADYLVAHGVTVQEWISVDDRLPDKPMKCLVYTKRGDCGGYEITYYNQGFNLQYSNVTHWMPLPLEPEVKND